jgi:hypothetical protein
MREMRDAGREGGSGEEQVMCVVRNMLIMLVTWRAC